MIPIRATTFCLAMAAVFPAAAAASADRRS